MAELNRETKWFEKKSALYLAVGVAVVLVLSMIITNRSANRQAAAVDSSGEFISNSQPPESITDRITGHSNPFETLLKRKKEAEYLNEPIPSDLEVKSKIENDELGVDGSPRIGDGRSYKESGGSAATMSPEAADAYNRMVLTLTSPLLANAEGSWEGQPRSTQASYVNQSETLGSARTGSGTSPNIQQGDARGRGASPIPYSKFNALSKSRSVGSSGSINNSGHGRQAIEREYAVDFEIPAGNVLEGYLTTAVNSDLPGDVVLQISRDVYDLRQETLLIPKGSRLIGRYEDQIAYGQNRVLQLWDRLILPNGDQFDVPNSRGVDLVGTSGIAGRVNNHWGKVIASATLVAVMGTAYELTQREQNNGLYPSRGSTIGSSISNEVARVAASIAQRGLSVKPTIQLPVGHPVKVLVRNSWVFSESYERVW